MTGALAVYDPNEKKIVTTWPLPVNKTKIGRSTETEICAVTLMQAMAEAIAEYGVCAIIIEDVHSSSQMGVVSAFNFGHTAGSISAIAKVLHHNTFFVSPQKWKTRLGLRGDKNVALEKARKLFGASPWFNLAKDHNKAEAALLAKFGADNLLDDILPKTEVDPLS